MKKLAAILFLCVSMILTDCGAANANAPQPTMAQPTDAQPVALALTETLTPVPTDTLEATATQQPSRTPSAPETCPQVNEKIRAQFGSAFKGKKDAYHDVRQVVLDFLNEGGNPQTAIAKLAENGVTASVLDVTADGVPEFLLPSGYYSIFGCHDGKYQTLLDREPSDYGSYEAVPLFINDLNQNGVPEILIAQVINFDGKSAAKYSLLEWDGAKLMPITQENYGRKNDYVHIENHDIYTVGKSNAEQGLINGNWELIDTDNDGLKEIAIKAGVDVTFFFSPFSSSSGDLEEQIILKSTGAIYEVVSHSIESTPTTTPTWTPLPFSKVCDYKAPNVTYNGPAIGEDKISAIQKFLNAGGDPQKLHDSFAITIQDLTGDKLPEIILNYNNSGIAYLYIFSCINGSYENTLEYGHDSSMIKILATNDLNKNGLPEIVLRGSGCFYEKTYQCGSLFIGEWNKEKFIGLIKGENSNDYVSTYFPQDAYVKDLDADGIFELVWVGGVSSENIDKNGKTGHVETYTYKWDGEHYTLQPTE